MLAAALAACESTLARLRGKRLTPLVTLDKLPPGSAYRTTHDEQPIVVVNAGGDVRAFLAVCTHEGCPLGWNPQQHLIRCPCHGSAFDTSGHVVNGPAKVGLTRLDTIVERGSVLLVE
jgi:Rieske Fe-S protein